MSFANENLSLQYIPAILKHQASHGWVIEYYARDCSGSMRRMVIRMNNLRKRFAKTADFREHCGGVVAGINAQLAGGWTPFNGQYGGYNTKSYTQLTSVLDEYLNDKALDVRPDTLVNYRSFCKVFRAFIDKNCHGIRCDSFNKVLAVSFMDYIRDDKGLSGRAYNNRLKQGRALFSWMIDRCYTTENPFATIKRKRETPKKRVLIPPECRARITEYFKDTIPNYVTLCQLVYSALLRPKEAWRLKIADLHLADGYIWVSEDEAKTHYSRMAALTPRLRDDLIAMTAKAAATDYLFGTDYRPGKTQIVYSRFRKEWDTMRRALKLPQEMQLYSLRDTGINEMLKSGIDPLTVMQHADHHDLSMTTRYANHADPRLVETISRRAPAF